LFSLHAVDQSKGMLAMRAMRNIEQRRMLYWNLAGSRDSDGTDESGRQGAARQPTAVGSSLRGCILIVDDDPLMLRYTRNLLECEGYDVYPVNSGAEALERLQSAALPDVILLDMMMPEMDGIETLSRILELAPSTKVIMLSGQHDAA